MLQCGHILIFRSSIKRRWHFGNDDSRSLICYNEGNKTEDEGRQKKSKDRTDIFNHILYLRLVIYNSYPTISDDG